MAISGDGRTVVAGADLANNETGAAFVFSDQSYRWLIQESLVRLTSESGSQQVTSTGHRQPGRRNDGTGRLRPAQATRPAPT